MEETMLLLKIVYKYVDLLFIVKNYWN